MASESSNRNEHSQLLQDLHNLRLRILRRDTLRRVLSAAWIYPLVAAIVGALVITFTAFRPVWMLVILYPVALILTAVVSWLRGLPLESAARRVDQMLGLKQRLATAFELLKRDKPEMLAPIVLAEASDDARKALARSLPGPAAANPLTLAALCLAALLLLNFVPSTWLPNLIKERHDKTMLASAGEALSADAERLHSAGPKLPGSNITRIQLDMVAAAKRAAQGAITPEQARNIVDRLNERLAQMQKSDISRAFDKDLHNFDAVPPLQKLLNDMRRGNFDDAQREIASLAENYANGTMTKDQIEKLQVALGSVAGNSTLPGVAEAASNLQRVIASGNNTFFKPAIEDLFSNFATAYAQARREEEITRTVQRDLRNVAALLTGQSTGESVPAQAVRELMPDAHEGTGAATTSPFSSGPNPDLNKQASLSRQVFEQEPILLAPAPVESNQTSYQRYVRRYFQQEK